MVLFVVLLEIFGYSLDICCDSCATILFSYWTNGFFWSVL